MLPVDFKVKFHKTQYIIGSFSFYRDYLNSHNKVMIMPLIEVIKFADQDGNQVKVSVAYPWLPSRCSICSKWGHKAKECVSNKVVILNKEEDSTVVIVEADPEKRIGLGNAKELVDGLLQELESLPIGGDSGVVGMQAGNVLETINEVDASQEAENVETAMEK